MSYQECLNLADELFARKNFKEAAKNYSVAIEAQFGNDSDLFFKRCQCFYELQDYDKALNDSTTFLQKNPDSVLGFLWKGRCLTKLSNFKEAYVEYKNGLELDPQNADVADDLRCLQDAIMAVYQEEEKRGESTYDAVQLCSQEPYPGDDELEGMEREIMMKWKLHEPINIVEKACDLDKAADEMAEAVEAKELEDLDKALVHINKSASYNPTNQFMLSERADILYRLQDYREAFRCCNSIPYEFRPAELWTIGGKILIAIGLPVMAETWLRIATRISKGTESEAPMLFQKIRVKRLYEPLAAGTKATVTFTKYGRAVVAREPVHAGDIIMGDTPAVCAQTIDTQHIPACGYCARSLLQPEDVLGSNYSSNNLLKKVVQKYWPKRVPIACRSCSKQIYCSDQCQAEAWERYHSLICPGVNKSMAKLWKICDDYKNLNAGDSRVYKGWWNAAFSPLIMARIWATIACNAVRCSTVEGRDKPSVEDWTMAKAPFRRFIAYGATSNADVIPHMFDLMVEIFKDLGNGLCYNITKREFDGRYYQATCNVQAFSDLANPYRLFLRYIKDKPNMKNLLQSLPQDIPESEFAGMFALHACMNHSCANNAEVMDGEVQGKPGVAVRARRDLKAGEEVFITYISTNLPRAQRRAWLYRAYNFWCYCERCEFEGDGPYVCTQCKKDAKGQKAFPTCSKCKKAWYCSTGCQKVAWKKGHKKVCSLSHSDTSSSSDQYLTAKQ